MADSSGVLGGVEKEAHSRFVDYTSATPWEELAADIEHTLTKWHKCGNAKQQGAKQQGEMCEPVELAYLGSTLTLALFDASNASTTGIHRWYDLANYALLARTNDWIDLTPSEVKSIFSALICGCQASGSHLPVFFASSSLARLSHSVAVLGYEICLGRGSRLRNGVRQYESTLLESINAKHDLYFLDGLLKYFKKSIHYYSSPDQLYVTVKETFTHTQSNSIPVCQYWTSETVSPGLFSKNLTRKDLLILNLRRRRSNCEHGQSFIQQLFISLNYANLDNLDHLLDNSSYTTLIPSKQPPVSWSMEAVFRRETAEPTSSNKSIVYALGYSLCVRRILGLYIYAKSVEGVRMVDLKLDARSMARATSIASILSANSRECLETLAVHFVDGDGGNGAPSSSRKEIQHYTQYLFQDLLAQSLSQNEMASGIDDLATSLPYGSWLSLLSILVGCSQGHPEDVASLWSDLLAHLREAWDGKNMGGFPFLYASKKEMGNNSAADESVPLWKRTLWDDLGEVSLPNKEEESIIMQKLQMLRFCTAVRDTSPTTACVYSHADVGHFVMPQLVRRIPITHDAVAMTTFVSQNLLTASGSELSQQLKVCLPAVIADIRAFKAANPTAEYSSFKKWYQVDCLAQEIQNEVGHTYGDFSELWASLDACEAAKQKPMFRAEAEAEKALLFLESITPIQFSAEMLIAAMSTTLSLLRGEVAEWIGSSIDDGDVVARNVTEGIAILEANTLCAVQKIRRDVAQFVTTAADSSISQDTLILVDDVCQGLDELETFVIKARELDTLLTLPHEVHGPRLRHAGRTERRRLVLALARLDAAAAVDSNESKRMQGLAKSFSPGSRPAHTWHSADGRELPLGERTCTISSSSCAQLRAILEHDRIRLNKVLFDVGNKL